MFIDTIGLGKGVYDRLRETGYTVSECKGSEKPFDDKQYENKRAENFFECKQWIKQGGYLFYMFDKSNDVYQASWFERKQLVGKYE